MKRILTEDEISSLIHEIKDKQLVITNIHSEPELNLESAKLKIELQIIFSNENTIEDYAKTVCNLLNIQFRTDNRLTLKNLE